MLQLNAKQQMAAKSNFVFIVLYFNSFIVILFRLTFAMFYYYKVHFF